MKYLTLSGGRKGLAPGRRGASTMGCLLFLLIAGVVGYVGFKVGEAYWTYFEVRQKTREALNWAAATPPKLEKEIVQRVIVKAVEVGVELSPRDIQIMQTPDTLTIIVSWTQEVEFPYYTLPLNFKTTQTEEKRWYKGGLIIK
jgi:hypothetical protein